MIRLQRLCLGWLAALLVSAFLGQLSEAFAAEKKAPINSRYAGDAYPKVKLPPGLQRKYPKVITFTADGYPDFGLYVQKTVRIRYTGSRPGDYKAANAKAGFRLQPRGTTWHHHRDCTTMQLLPTDLHNAVRHTGGYSKCPPGTED